MRYVIIGLGVAGITASKTLRNLDRESEIHIFTDETSLYYPRPKLFDVIAGDIKARDLYYYDSSWYEENNINLHLGFGIRKVDFKKHSLLLEYGGEFKYDRLLLANGASSFVPEIKGLRADGVFTLRKLDDAFKIRRHSFLIGNGSSVAIVGGGVLGLEASHSFKINKLQPIVIEKSPFLLPKQLDKEGADILKGIFENWGIRIKTDSVTAEVIGDPKVKKLILDNGEVIPVDMVLVSSGVRSNIDLLERSGLPFSKGAIVDEHMQVSEDIYAAGDIAEFSGKTYGIIPPAIEQATIAAKNMFKESSTSYNGSVPTNTLKVAGLDFTSVGNINYDESDPQVEMFRAKEPLQGKYRKVILKNNKIVGIIILGIKGEAVQANKLVQKEFDASAYKDKLRNLSFSLKEIKI